jgi:peptidoglycan hydrolase-like protein with peptidoglycan-binding domain
VNVVVNREASAVVRRQRAFLSIAVLAALVSTAGLVAATFVKSPAEQAAEQGPPSASVLTAPVVRQVLTQTVAVRGTVVAGSSLAVTPTAAQGATALVITRIVKQPGQPVKAGDVLVEVSGRPVIALPGAVPAYRDLQPGDTGADIGELQAALTALGYPDPDRRGTFGSGTKAAVSLLYQRLGYAVPTTGGLGDKGDAAALQAAEQAVLSVQRAVDSDTQAVAKAQADVDTAGTATPPDPHEMDQDRAVLTQAQQNLTFARQDLSTAETAQAQLIATTGIEMPLNEFVFVPSFPAVLAALRGGVGTAVTAPLVTLNIGDPVVNAVVPQAEQTVLKAGQSVHLDAEALNLQADATLADIGAYTSGSRPQADSSAPPQPAGYPIVVRPTQPLASPWLGQDVRVTIEAATTPGQVLVVPVAAVSTGQDGTTVVTVLTGDNQRVRVPVTAGLDANGMVQVTPSGVAGLHPGDLVVVG